jgi:hypothetical protein
MALAPRIRNQLNPRRVIFWMTVGVFIILGWLMIAVFDGFPPWPVAVCFTISHVFFCVVISKVRPYRGPHTEPMSERTTKDWE